MDDKLVVPHAKKDFSEDELLKLLAYLEGELQARDIVIAVLKSEKAKHLFYGAKYGQLAGSDPVKALERDSNFVDDGNIDESRIGQMYETQLLQLERLIAVQRHCHNRSKQILAAAEKRHARILRELDEDQRRSAADAAQGDDLCALFENERTRLRQQLEYEQKETDKARKKIVKLEKKLKEEQERHKSMVLFLINERKQMLFEVHELKIQSSRDSSFDQEASLLVEIRKEAAALRSERDQLRTTLDATLSELQTLKMVAKSQEEDLALLRNNILSNTRTYSNKLRTVDDGSIVVANKSISNALLVSKNPSSGLPTAAAEPRHHPLRPKLSTSSTFPTSDRISRSRVPLRSPARVLPTTVPFPSPKKGQQNHSASTRPATLSGVRNNNNHLSSHDREMSSSSNIPERMKNAYTAEPEIEQLGAVIDSMNIGSKRTQLNSLSTQMNQCFSYDYFSDKRSASLPRNNKNGGIMGSQARKPTLSKPAVTPKRSTIFRALGVATRNDKNC
ncbi:unnamed protein product [Thelazia callipaeda]|uniref:CortBP2 domain-containing protein n=1 Tax=Thelazia callipaeda TaxID=103827 RepID=A0A0N5D587_THECL|nr:unnamed protein product [Thelazia callipaeda]